MSHDARAAGATAGMPAYAKLWSKGYGAATTGKPACLVDHRDEIARWLG